MRRRLSPYLLLVALTAVLGTLLASAPAHAATTADKLTVLSSFTQPNAPSYSSWNSARQNQSAWSDYNLDWSTDYCSSSPDQPLGFDFRLPCWRHDFGYRNYKAMGQFPATNKDRVDNAFYFDLKAKCATYSVVVRDACNGLAWTYYQAVHLLGAIVVDQATLRKYAVMKVAAENAARQRTR